MPSRETVIYCTKKYSVNNYVRLPLVAESASGVWVSDVNGDRYLDMLGVYAAASCGHNHPKIVSAICEHLKRNGISSMSGGYYSVPYAELVWALTRFCQMDKVILKTGGSEAFEVAIKIAKRWGYQSKRIPSDCAEIIGCNNNFHGRLPNAMGLSTEDRYKEDFGPFPLGLKSIPFNDPDALGRTITRNTAAFVVEPIQGEGGVNVPEDGYFKEVEKICHRYNVLLIADEIQTGFGRTGYNFAYEHEGVKPDMLIIAKALGGGLMPVSGVLASNRIMNLIGPGDEGSTFGSHPLSCVAALETLNVLQEERLTEKSRVGGNYLRSELKKIKSPLIKEVRGRGLLVGIELVPGTDGAKYFRKELFVRGIICETAGDDKVIRFSPPLIIGKHDLDWAIEQIKKVFQKG